MNALLSASDTPGIVEFAQALQALGIGLLSTGGTARLLAGQGLPGTEVGELTQWPEMLDGRVKTLHPKGPAGLPGTARAYGGPEGSWHSHHRPAGGQPVPV